MNPLTWDQVLERTDLIGGDLESTEDGDVYRGPLSAIKKEGSMIHFDMLWTAKLDKKTGKWHPWNVNSISVSTEHSTPVDIGDNRVRFGMVLLGHITLFPQGGSQLDPNKVEGLELPAG